MLRGDEKMSEQLEQQYRIGRAEGLGMPHNLRHCMSTTTN